MKAVCWMGVNRVSVEDVPDPQLLNPRDAIVRVSSTAICGSDLHLVDGYMPGMKSGDILGHEFMGEVVEVGSEVSKVRPGTRVIVSGLIACGNCTYCERGLTAQCDNTNPNAWILDGLYGFSAAAVFGHPHPYGGYAGGQAQYVRVPFADMNSFAVPDELRDEQVLFLTDVFPTGWMAADNCDIKRGDVVAVWGCGAVGQFAIRSAYLLGADRVIAIDRFADRLALAAAGGADTIDYEAMPDVVERLKQLTAGRGPDACIDAVGMEAHAPGVRGIYDRAKQAARIESDRPHALRQAIQACRKGGVVSVAGAYGGLIDKFPIGAVFEKGLTLRSGPTHMHRYIPLLLERIQGGEIDPSTIVSHRVPLDDAADAYHRFKHKEGGWIKVVLDPWAPPLARPETEIGERERETDEREREAALA